MTLKNENAIFVGNERNIENDIYMSLKDERNIESGLSMIFKNSKNDQEIPQSQTADKPVAS